METLEHDLVVDLFKLERVRTLWVAFVIDCDLIASLGGHLDLTIT